ncbi:MAG: aspartate kinase [Chloroflexota bacterium]
MATLTMKFGGTCLGTPAALTQVISIILQEHERWDQLIVVASALDGVTDALIEAAHLAQLSNRRGYRRIIATVRTRHLALVDKLPLGPDERGGLRADIDQLLFEMLDVCQNLSDMPLEAGSAADQIDQVIGVGERLAARIIAALLRENKLRGVAVDATDFVITDDTFNNATPDLIETQARIQQILIPMLSRNIIPVVTGFIGATTDGRPTTLGRGGSDYTASIVGICTQSDAVWMWTEVDGMMSTDPREVETAQVIPELSYSEVAELAFFGARILHARMIEPLQRSDIPLYIKNVFKPQQPGTVVRSKSKDNTHRIKAVTVIQGIGLRANRAGSLHGITELVSDTLEEKVGSPADVMIASQSSKSTFLCFVIPTSAGPDAVHSAEHALVKVLDNHPENDEPWQVMPVSVVTAIGAQLDERPDVMAQVLVAVGDAPLLGIAQGPARCSLSLIVLPEHADAVLERVHSLTE